MTNSTQQRYGDGMQQQGTIRMAGMILAALIAGLVLIGCGTDDKPAGKSPEATVQAKPVKQLWTCGMHPDVIKEEPGNCPICGMTLVPVKQEVGKQADTQDMAAMQDDGGMKEQEQGKAGKKILYWRAPMDPTYIRNKPGKSPMGMDLVPVYEGEGTIGGGPTIVIDPVTVQNIGVQKATVKKVRLSRIIRTVGHVDYNEETISRVNVKFSGWIERLYVDKTGQEVKKGQPMAEIYSPDLVTTQQEYLLAYRNLKKTKDSPFSDVASGGESLLESARKRLKYWDITDRQIKDLEERGTVNKTVMLYAPYSGIVIGKMAERGMRVTPGLDLYRIADLSTVWVIAHIYDYEVPWVKLGQDVVMDLPYIPGKMFHGKVNYVYPYLDQKVRDIKVRLVFKNPGMELKPEMYANVQLESKIGSDVTAIPNDAILRSGKRNLVFVDKGGGKFEPRDVVLGPEGQNGLVQVLAGVGEGETIVTSAQFLFDSESRLKEAIQKMLESRSSVPSKEDLQ